MTLDEIIELLQRMTRSPINVDNVYYNLTLKDVGAEIIKAWGTSE